jgi:hypothetical protein
MLQWWFIHWNAEGISMRGYSSHESINPELVRSVQRHPCLPKHQKKQGSLEDLAISTKQPCGLSRKVPTLRHVESSFHPILWIVTDKVHAWNDAKSKVSIEMESGHSSCLSLLDRLYSQENDDSHKSSRRHGLHR